MYLARGTAAVPRTLSHQQICCTALLLGERSVMQIEFLLYPPENECTRAIQPKGHIAAVQHHSFIFPKFPYKACSERGNAVGNVILAVAVVPGTLHTGCLS